MSKTKRITGDEVVRHRNEINRVRGEYNVLEEKLFVLVYSKLTGHETDLPPITLLTTDVCRALGTRHEDMRRAMKRLTVTPMEVGQIDDMDADYEVIMPIIRFVHLAKEKTITITLNPALKDYFLAVRQQFTTYIAEHCYRLSSRYSIRIYKLIMQWWSKIEAHGEWEVVLDYQDLREYFLFKPSQYAKAFEFKRAVLIPAIEDINKAQVGLDLELVGVQKAGRNITDYVILARKATGAESKKAVRPSKKQLTDADFVEKYRAEYDAILDSIMATESLSVDLPLGVPRPKPEVIRNMAETEALAELRKRHKN